MAELDKSAKNQAVLLELLLYPVIFTIWKWNWEIIPELAVTAGPEEAG